MIIEIQVPDDNTCDGCIANDKHENERNGNPSRCRLFNVNLQIMKKGEQWVGIPCNSCKDSRPIY
jgi:hypothetical protein